MTARCTALSGPDREVSGLEHVGYQGILLVFRVRSLGVAMAGIQMFVDFLPDDNSNDQ